MISTKAVPFVMPIKAYSLPDCASNQPQMSLPAVPPIVSSDPERVQARGLFNPTVVEELKHEHLSGGHSHSDRLWTLLITELWMQQYLDGHGLWTFS